MFGLFKKKLKEAIGLFSKKAEDVAEKEVITEEKKKSVKEKPVKEKKQKKEHPTKEKKHIKEKELIAEEKEESQEPEQIIEEEHEEKKKKGFFAKLKEKITYKKISEEQFSELFWDLEVILLENNVALEVIEKIKEDLEKELVNQPVKDIEKTIKNSLRNTIEHALIISDEDFIDRIKKSKKPYTIVFVGTNGSGKTTTIAKIAHLLKKNKLSSVLVAGDTWRSAAIEQLSLHAKKLNTNIVKSNYGSDPAAIAFDGIAMAKARKIDVVLVDTAGRQHSNSNLIQEMEKIIRVAKPDLKIFVGESMTGNDCIEQITQFNKSIGIDGIILTKADVDEKGGTAISISYVSKKPILFITTGQEYENLEPFTKEKILKSLDME